MSVMYVTEKRMRNFADFMRDITKKSDSYEITFPYGFAFLFAMAYSYATQIDESKVIEFAKSKSVSFPLSQLSLSFFDCSILKMYAFESFSFSGDIYLYNCEIMRQYCFAYAKPKIVYASSSCKTIESNAFWGASIQQAFYPKCEYVGHSAFRNCYNLSTVTLGAAVIKQSAFYSCSSLKTITVGTSSSFITIETKAFSGTYPSVVRLTNCEKIQSYAFYGDNFSLYLSGSNITELEPNVFSRYTSARIYVPSSLYSQYKAAENWHLISSRIRSVW